MEILIQILFYQGLFLLAYQLIKKSSFFQLNRFYLLGSLLASFILPFLELNWFQFSLGQEHWNQFQTVYLPEVMLSESKVNVQPFYQEKSSLGYLPLLENLYWVGFAVAVAVFYVKLLELIKLINDNISYPKDRFKIVFLKESKEAFSFYDYIFLGNEMDEEERQAILLHEQQHVHYKHSLDNSLLAILRVFMWFNPLLFFYQKELQLLHEYQADAGACQHLNAKTYTYQLLQTAFQTQNLGFTSSFYNTSFIKKRILMLHKKESSTFAILKYALITPILALLIGHYSLAQTNLPDDEQALLELYKKEITELLEKKDMSVYYDYVLEVEKYENNILTKDGFYRMKAFSVLALEHSSKTYSKKDIALLEEDYAAYVKRVKEQKNVPSVNKKQNNTSAVPFASVERVPIYPGCDENASNEELRNCMIKSIQQHVNDNFDIAEARKYGVENINRVYVRFQIKEDGSIDDVEARSSHPKLSKTGEDVIQKLPKMKPAEHQGEAVNVVYTLPISFANQEKEKEE